jgi:hypothetical protein
MDSCQTFQAIHRFGQVVVTAGFKRTLAVFGRGIRSYHNDRDPLPALPPYADTRQRQSILIFTQRNIPQDQANVGLASNTFVA